MQPIPVSINRFVGNNTTSCEVIEKVRDKPQNRATTEISPETALLADKARAIFHSLEVIRNDGGSSVIGRDVSKVVDRVRALEMLYQNPMQFETEKADGIKLKLPKPSEEAQLVTASRISFLQGLKALISVCREPGKVDLKNLIERINKFLSIQNYPPVQLMEIDERLMEKIKELPERDRLKVRFLLKNGAAASYNASGDTVRIFTDHLVLTRNRLPLPQFVKNILTNLIRKVGLIELNTAHELVHRKQSYKIKDLRLYEVKQILSGYLDSLDRQTKKILLKDKDIKAVDDSITDPKERMIIGLLKDLPELSNEKRLTELDGSEYQQMKLGLIELVEAGILSFKEIRTTPQGIRRYIVNKPEMEARLGSSAFVVNKDIEMLSKLREVTNENRAEVLKALTRIENFLIEKTMNDGFLRMEESAVKNPESWESMHIKYALEKLTLPSLDSINLTHNLFELEELVRRKAYTK